MRLRKLGSSSLQVTPLCFGGNVFGWTLDEEQSFEVLDALIDGGINFIDTADVYSTWAPGNTGGESETIIGKWLKRSGKRDKIVLATKLGKEMGGDKKGLSRKYMQQAIEASLRRLQTDYVDLYQSHEDDPSTPIEETLEGFGELIKAGKVRAIGASNYKGERLAEAMRIGREKELPSYCSLQPHYNLYFRAEFEATLEPVCARFGLGVIPYYSLASGFLTGKYRSQNDISKSARGVSVGKMLNERGFKILAALDRAAEKHNATPAQVSLAWLMARPSVTAPIASATSREQLAELIGAASLELDGESMKELNEASA